MLEVDWVNIEDRERVKWLKMGFINIRTTSVELQGNFSKASDNHPDWKPVKSTEN